MIAVETESGELVKILKNVADGEYGLHAKFGLIGKERAQERAQTRKRQGFDFATADSDEAKWHCSFNLAESAGKFNVKGTQNCNAEKISEGWMLDTPLGKFKLVQGGADYVDTLLVDHEDEASWLNRALEWTIILTFVLLPVLYFLEHNAEKEEEVKEEKIIEPIEVKIIKIPEHVVNIAKPVNPNIKVKPISKAERSKRAVKRNLGFLGMVGSKDMKKVVGGVPQKLEKATAGAGAGGDAGSGGEVLTGLGKGLKKTTVGNTGVAGLGGIGTKGAGGGKGGYGNTLVASGSGKGISAIAVSNSDVTLEGGISRYAINATIAKYLNQVRRCYETQLKTKPEIQGLVEMGFEINAKGRLNYAKVRRSTLKDKPTEQCIQQKMMTWQFPKPKGGVTVPVKYPFMLRPVGS